MLCRNRNVRQIHLPLSLPEAVLSLTGLVVHCGVTGVSLADGRLRWLQMQRACAVLAATSIGQFGRRGGSEPVAVYSLPARISS